MMHVDWQGGDWQDTWQFGFMLIMRDCTRGSSSEGIKEKTHPNVRSTEAGLHISPQVNLTRTPQPLIRSEAQALTLTGVPQNPASDS